MAKRMYSDILADILNKKYSRCVCPTEYLSGLPQRRPSTGGGGSCQFGPDCQLTPICAFDEARCTCYGGCVCGVEARSLPPPSARPPGPRPLAPRCDRALCTCTTCLCRPDESSPDLLPAILRSAVKRQANALKSDELIKRECREIKQLIEEHEESKRLESAKQRRSVDTHKSVKLQDSLDKDDVVPVTGDSLNNYGRKASSPFFDPSQPQQSTEGLQKSFIKSKTSSRETKRQSTKKDKKGSGKKVNSKYSVEFIKKDGDLPSKKPSIEESEYRKKSSSPIIGQGQKQVEDERKNVRKSNAMSRDKRHPSSKKEKLTRKDKRAQKRISVPPSTARTKYIGSYCGCTSTFRRPVRLRYYYSGGVEHWGVKLGHRNCFSIPPLVPKHMGWLWNIEDPTKGIRERKGWPPGFIGKNIKNMMQVMKRVEEAEGQEGPGGQGGGGPRSAWRPVEMVEEAQPPRDDPPLLHVLKKGRVCNITFCPRESDEDLAPVPIPFSITEKKKDSGTESSDSTLELELHAPKVRGPPKLVRKVAPKTDAKKEPGDEDAHPPSGNKKPKKKPVKKPKSRGSEENKILWEEQQTQIQNVS